MHRRQVHLKSLLSPYPEGAADILLQSVANSPEYVQMHVFVQTPHDMDLVIASFGFFPIFFFPPFLLS